MARNLFLPVLLILILACALPGQGTQQPGAPQAPAAPSGPVQILSPQNGATVPAAPLQIQFTASGGPFIETDLTVDGDLVSTTLQDGTSDSISGSLSWDAPTAGAHTIAVQVVTSNKDFLSASIQIIVEGTAGNNPVAPQPPAQPPAQTSGAPGSAFPQDPAYAAARQRIIQILHDDYQLNVTAPPVGRKYRYGVTDPWISVVYLDNWVIDITLYPDGRETKAVYPLNAYPSVNAPSYLGPGDKPIPMCRPTGTVRPLVVFVDYQNLNVNQTQAFELLTRVTNQLNATYASAAAAGGAQSPILQLQTTGAFISPPPPMPELLLTSDIVRTYTGYDPAQFDLLIQVDLDSAATYRHQVLIPQNFDTFGFASGGCGSGSLNVNQWISLETTEQANGTDTDTRLLSTVAHEFLHNSGYPFEHDWPCGDGSLQEGADECVESNLPTLMLGWVDIDGDGIVEILDPTPYGISQP